MACPKLPRTQVTSRTRYGRAHKTWHSIFSAFYVLRLWVPKCLPHLNTTLSHYQKRKSCLSVRFRSNYCQTLFHTKLPPSGRKGAVLYEGEKATLPVSRLLPPGQYVSLERGLPQCHSPLGLGWSCPRSPNSLRKACLLQRAQGRYSPLVR